MSFYSTYLWFEPLVTCFWALDVKIWTFSKSPLGDIEGDLKSIFLHRFFGKDYQVGMVAQANTGNY